MCSQIFFMMGSLIKRKKEWEYGHEDNSRWHCVCRKTALLKCISFTASKETSVNNFWPSRLILMWKVAEWSALQKYRVYFKFLNFQRIYKLRKLKIFIKKLIFFAARNSLKTKKKYEKTLFTFVEQTIPFMIEMNVDYVGQSIPPLVFLPRTLFLPFSANNSFYTKKTGKSTRQLPQLLFEFTCVR